MQNFMRCRPTVDRNHWPVDSALPRGDNPLDAMRGIVAGIIMSLLLFWFPLALALTR